MDLNTATPNDLHQLPGVGCVTTRLIIEARPFSSVADLLHVKGIGPVKFAAIATQNRVFVGENLSESKIETKHTVNPSKIDLNAASETQLQQLKGVGPALAQRIVKARPFHRKEDLLAVKGIGQKSYVKMQFGAQVAGEFKMRKSGNDDSEASDCGDSDNDEKFHFCREIESDVRKNVFPNAKFKGEGRALLVASWNIRNISRRKETYLLQRIADILDEFDLVALQEVRDLIVLKRLKTMLPGWDYVVSEPVGRKAPGSRQRAERYAFFFRRCAVRIIDKCSLLQTNSNVFTRLPCVATFRAMENSGLQDLELSLMNVHVSFGEKEKRHAEIVEINRMAAELSEKKLKDRKVVVLGDFNLSPQDVLGSLGSHRMALIRSPLSTTVFGRLYDNIWIDREDFTSRSSNTCKSSDYLVDSGVLRVDWRYYPLSKSNSNINYMKNPEDAMLPRLQTYMSRMQCGYELSDHCPVWVAFATANTLKRDINDEEVPVHAFTTAA